METKIESNGINRNAIIQGLWIYLSINYVMCDVMTLMISKNLQGFLQGNIDGFAIDPVMLAMWAGLMQVSFIMTALSRILKGKVNRVVSIVMVAISGGLQTWSLFQGSHDPHYIVFSALEIGTAVVILILSIAWFNKD